MEELADCHAAQLDQGLKFYWRLRRVEPLGWHDSAGEWYGSIAVELESTLSFDALRAILRRVEDGHVMVQALRPVPLAENTLDRDWTVD